MTDRLRLLPVTRAAIAFDLIAIGCLAAAVLAAHQRTELFSLLLCSCLFGVPAAGVGAGTSAIALVREAERRGVRRRISTPVAVVLALAALPIGWGAIAAAWEATPNPADEALRPVVAAAEAAGGMQLCDAGDPGLGPDNTQPWRTVWLQMPADGSALSRVEAAAAARGHVLRQHRPDRAIGEESVRGTTYLRSAAPGTAGALELDVASRTMPLRCGGGEYGRPFRPPAGRVAVRLSLSLADRRP